MSGAGASPLAGVRVLEIGIAMAGPYCAMLLGDLGAEVIKIERPAGGDESRNWPPFFSGGESHYFLAANRNKRSVTVDLKRPEGVAVARRLAAASDVLVENYRVGVLERLGLGYARLRELNPRLVYCSISGFGATGPRAQEPANDIFMQAYSGGMSLTGEEGGPPAKMGLSVADLSAALFATIGVLAALQARAVTGEGQQVQTSLLEAQVAMLSYHLTYYFATGEAPVARGSANATMIPYQAFQARDGWVVVGAFTERMWQGVCRALDRPHLAEDPRFRTNHDRLAHRAEILGLLERRFAEEPAAHWIVRMAAESVPCAPVHTVGEVAADAQVRAREMVVDVPHGAVDGLRMAGLPIKLGATPGAIHRPPPLLGQHTEEVLRELGLRPEEIAAVGVAHP
jgi:crotonobetainyl-CoA:carnitine CoA-transferase CaiB-like acyl-CoA transferase